MPTISSVEVVNQGKAHIPIRTGLGFMDHMLDQWNSHAQIGVGLLVEEATSPNHFATSGNQIELCHMVGAALGVAMSASLPSWSSTESRFCCPLDEALVECHLKKATVGKLVEYQLAPYGRYPTGKGRSRIGHWETDAIEHFWMALAESAQIELSFRKIRGDNGHHIVESSFKAFSRALREALDMPSMFGPQSENDLASIALGREAKVERSTKETSISVHLLLNGSTETSVDTGIPLLDDFVSTFCQHGQISCRIHCQGDLWVDDHHTAEDVSIAIGQCLTDALGTKAGLNRMGVAQATVGDATVEVTMDLSNRPYLGHNLHATLGREEFVDGMSCEMIEHMLDSLVMNGRMTVHVVELQAGDATVVKDTILATAEALGQALRVCAMVDQRRAGQTASSKGTLSV